MNEGINSFLEYLTEELWDNKFPSKKGAHCIRELWVIGQTFFAYRLAFCTFIGIKFKHENNVVNPQNQCAYISPRKNAEKKIN